MKPTDFFYGIVTKFAKMPTDDKNQIFTDMKDWEQKLEGKPEKTKLEELYIKHSTKWYVRLIFGGLYIYSIKQIHLWLTDLGEEDDEDLDLIED